MKSTPRILIVEDEEDLRLSLSFALEQEGFEVLMAEDGTEGFRAACEETPDLILMDVMMPGENGYRVSRKLREREQGTSAGRTPIILLTARDLSTDPEREKTFLEFSGADRMLYKPFDLEDLSRQIRELLRC